MGRTRKSRNSSKSVKHIVKLINRTDLGHQLRRGADPPVVVVMPWWPITIEFNNSGSMKYDAVAILSEIAKLATFSVSSNLLMRMDSIRVWGTANPIQLNIFGLIGEGNLCSLSDRPTQLNYAHAGWKFGSTHRNVVFSGDQSLKSFETIATVIGKCLVRVHCYVRVSSVVPTLDENSLPILDEDSLSDDFCDLKVSPLKANA